jgi:deoxyribodipyrimidine photo-lyase
VLFHHPHAATGAFRREYESIRWPNNLALFAAWREAHTGYPLVDAAMRQINATGYMHNRLRMVTASFLVKDLLVDWRLGEGYFAANLNDFDLAQNNGGWQWAASTGLRRAALLPHLQPGHAVGALRPARGASSAATCPSSRACPTRTSTRRGRCPRPVQQAAGCVIGTDYPGPVVDHAVQREKALALYGKVKR